MTEPDDFYVYEDWTVHTATLHHGSCRYCNQGAGQFGGGVTKSGGWHEAFGTEAEARATQLRAGSILRDCGICM